MTNAEKFEEIFGIKINEELVNMCNIVDRQICVDASDCNHCPSHKFWEKQYRKRNLKRRIRK